MGLLDLQTKALQLEPPLLPAALCVPAVVAIYQT